MSSSAAAGGGGEQGLQGICGEDLDTNSLTMSNSDSSSSSSSSSLSVVSAAEKSLASSSYSDFFTGKHVECMQSLLKLVNSRPHDPKVAHNKAVIEYFLSDFKRTDEFKKNLNYVCSQANVNLDDVDSLDDVEHCVLYYNYAVILYHLRQYHASLTIMDKVFQFIEPLEENLGKKVCFLLLELSLRAYQPDKALGMINFIESMLFDTAHVHADQSGKASTPDKDEETDLANKAVAKSEKDASENDVYRPKLQQYKVRCCLMVRSQKGCKRELKSLTNSSGLGPTTFYLKANFEYMRGNYRKALKLLNTAPAPTRPFAETGENVPVLFYNNMGCIHFYLGRPNLGYLYFQKALQENESAVKRLAKPDSGAKNNRISRTGVNGRPIYTVGANFRYELLYNMGIQLLHGKKPREAFECLVEAVQVFQSNPRLWLRMAECCIQIHQNDNEADFRLKERKKEMIQSVVGSGHHRKILLTPYINKPYQVGQDTNLSSIPVPTLEFASVFLKNASVLLENALSSGHLSSSRVSDESDNGNGTDSNPWLPTSPGNPIKGQDISSLKCSILAASAYVALHIGDIQMALHHAETLLAQPKLSGVHRFLGHLYAGEALIYLDRISDAVQQLNPANVKDLSFAFTSSADREDKGGAETPNNQDPANKGWFPNSVAVARTIMQYNLTVAYTIRGELERAGDALKQINVFKGSGTDIPIQALMLSMYIQMQLGHADMAKSVIRQTFPQYR